MNNDSEARTMAMAGVLRLLAGAFPTSGAKFSKPDVLRVWLEILGERDPEILLIAAKAVCSREEFPSTAVVDKWYRRIAAERRDEQKMQQIARIESDHEAADAEYAAEALQELREICGGIGGNE